MDVERLLAFLEAGHLPEIMALDETAEECDAPYPKDVQTRPMPCGGSGKMAERADPTASSRK